MTARPNMTVAEELDHQSWLEIFPGGGAVWRESQNTRYVALMVWRAEQRSRAPSSSDPIVEAVKQGMKSRRGYGKRPTIMPKSTPDGRL